MMTHTIDNESRRSGADCSDAKMEVEPATFADSSLQQSSQDDAGRRDSTHLPESDADTVRLSQEEDSGGEVTPPKPPSSRTSRAAKPSVARRTRAISCPKSVKKERERRESERERFYGRDLFCDTTDGETEVSRPPSPSTSSTVTSSKPRRPTIISNEDASHLEVMFKAPPAVCPPPARPTLRAPKGSG